MRKVWRLFFLRSSQAQYKQDYQSEILKWCGNSCGVDPWSDKGTVNNTPESTYLVELRMFALLSGLWKYLFQKDEYCILILGLDNAGKSVGWAGFIFSLTITYVPLCGGYDPVSQFFRKLRSFEDGPLLSIGWISLFGNLILVHVTIPCRDHLYHTLPIYLLCRPRKGGLAAFF